MFRIIRLSCSNWGLQSQRERWHLGLKHRNWCSPLFQHEAPVSCQLPAVDSEWFIKDQQSGRDQDIVKENKNNIYIIYNFKCIYIYYIYYSTVVGLLDVTYSIYQKCLHLVGIVRSSWATALAKAPRLSPSVFCVQCDPEIAGLGETWPQEISFQYHPISSVQIIAIVATPSLRGEGIYEIW